MKKMYKSPMLMTLNPGEDPTIIIANSQGTSGEDPIYSWDPNIDPDDIDLFWMSYDETDLPGIDTSGDFFISKDEFDTWKDGKW